LESVTAKENARIERIGILRDEAVEPLTNFFVSRAQQDLRGGSTQMGAMVGAVHRNLDAPQLGFLHRSAFSGGLDLLHQWRNKDWYVAGTAAASRVHGEARALVATQTAPARYFQRPDNDYENVDSTRTSLDGHAGSMRFGKRGGKHWRFETGGAWRSPGFEINDLGFLRSADQFNQFTWGQYSIRNSFSIFRQLSINGNQWTDYDFGGGLLQRQANMNFNLNFKNQWNTGAGCPRLGPTPSCAAARRCACRMARPHGSGSTAARAARCSRASAPTSTIGRKHCQFATSGPTPVRPTNMRVTLSRFYSTSDRELQFIFCGRSATRHLFGTLDQGAHRSSCG
jgi:hypothetical protein